MAAGRSRGTSPRRLALPPARQAHTLPLLPHPPLAPHTCRHPLSPAPAFFPPWLSIYLGLPHLYLTVPTLPGHSPSPYRATHCLRQPPKWHFRPPLAHLPSTRRPPSHAAYFTTDCISFGQQQDSGRRTAAPARQSCGATPPPHLAPATTWDLVAPPLRAGSHPPPWRAFCLPVGARRADGRRHGRNSCWPHQATSI